MKLPHIVSFLFTAGLLGANANSNYQTCLDPDSIDTSKDYFPQKVSPQFSEQWDITYHNTYKILTTKHNSKTYLLYQCGTEIPESEVGKHTAYHSVPLQDGIGLSSTNLLPHVEQLGLRRQVKGWFTFHSYISSPCMSELAASEDIFPEVNDDNKDQFFADHPDVVVIGSGSDANYIDFSTYLEAESKDIYEWHKVFGALFNLEKLANDQFDASSDRFDCASANAKYLTDHRDSSSSKPVVAWAYYSDPSTWEGTGEPYWDVARCDAKNLYYCEFATACDADILHSNDGSIENNYYADDFHMTSDEFFAFAKDADHWIYTAGNWDAVYAEFKDDLDQFKSVQNDEVYDTNGSGSGAWFEQRVAEYDIVLQDFCEVVGNNDDSTTPHERMYFRKLLPTAEQMGSLGTCSLSFVDLPWESRASECVYLSELDDHDSHDHGEESSSANRAGLAMSTAILFVMTYLVL